MKIHFTSSKSKIALETKNKLIAKYRQISKSKADVIVAVGGDGEMLRALRESISINLPVFGINKGHIGYLMNRHKNVNLINRIKNAVEMIVHTLEMKVKDIIGKEHSNLAIN